MHPVTMKTKTEVNKYTQIKMPHVLRILILPKEVVGMNRFRFVKLFCSKLLFEDLIRER